MRKEEYSRNEEEGIWVGGMRGGREIILHA